MFGLKIQTPTHTTRKNAILDFAITGKKVSMEVLMVTPSPSDHFSVTWSMTVETPMKKKPVKIPSRRTAEMITTKLIDDSQIDNTSKFFETLDIYRKLYKRKRWELRRVRTSKSEDLLTQLLSMQKDQSVNQVISEHWAERWKETEQKRFSPLSKEAYRNLKQILKYHLYEKRDGAIINCIKMEDGRIETQKDELEKQIYKTMEEIQVDQKWGWIEQKELPKIGEIKHQAMMTIMEQLATNKAIAFDQLTDSLFKGEKMKQSRSL